MPANGTTALTAQDHVAMADRNEEFLGRLDLRSDPEWSIIVAFYSAIHRIDAYLVHFHGLDPGSHPRRTSAVTSRLRQARDAYRFLQDHCHAARYVSVSIPVSVAERCRDVWLPEIKSRTKIA